MKLNAPHYFQPHSVLCKVCGVEIAGIVGTGRSQHFAHHATYRELKMQMDDGSFHVTNVCSMCLPAVRDDRKALQRLYTADLMWMRSQVPALGPMLGGRLAVRTVAATTRPAGLI